MPLPGEEVEDHFAVVEVANLTGVGARQTPQHREERRGPSMSLRLGERLFDLDKAPKGSDRPFVSM